MSVVGARLGAQALADVSKERSALVPPIRQLTDPALAAPTLRARRSYRRASSLELTLTSCDGGSHERIVRGIRWALQYPADPGLSERLGPLHTPWDESLDREPEVPLIPTSQGFQIPGGSDSNPFLVELSVLVDPGPVAPPCLPLELAQRSQGCTRRPPHTSGAKIAGHLDNLGEVGRGASGGVRVVPQYSTLSTRVGRVRLHARNESGARSQSLSQVVGLNPTQLKSARSRKSLGAAGGRVPISWPRSTTSVSSPSDLRTPIAT